MPLRITLRQLEVFTSICRQKTVSSAATAARLSQSAASQSLAELESALDGPLFDRVGRRLQINDRGRALLPLALDLIDRGNALEATLRGHGEEVPPSVQLAASLTIGNYLLPPILARLLNDKPQAHIGLIAMNTEAVINSVLDFRADAGFIEGTTTHPDLVVLPWRQDQLRVVAAADHPLARRRRMTPVLLNDEDWILRERGSGTRQVFEHALQLAGMHARVTLELSDTEAVKRAVAAGSALTCLSDLVVADMIRSGELAALPTPFLKLDRRLFVVLHRRKYLSTGLRSVLSACGLTLTDHA